MNELLPLVYDELNQPAAIRMSGRVRGSNAVAMNTYTDARLLDTAEAVETLPIAREDAREPLHQTLHQP